MSVSDQIEDFADQVRGREVNSESTLEGYTRWIKRFEAWRPGDEPDEGLLRDFDSFLQDEDRVDYPWENARGPSAPDAYAYRSRIKALSAVKLWVRHHHGTRIETEVQNIAMGEPAPFEPTVLDPQDAERVINDADMVCQNDGCQAAIAVGHDAIMRGAEVADARVEDVDRENQALYVRAKKGSEPATIQLGDTAWRMLSDHVSSIGDRDRLFRNSYDRAWTASAWNQHFRRKHHEAGFHSFARHTPITNRLRRGEEFGQVYLRARHQQPTTTLRYVNFIGDEVETPDWV